MREISTDIREYTPAQKKGLIIELGACQVTQRTYGKQGQDMEAAIRVFTSDLKEFSPEQIMEALARWRLKSPEFPTPYDIKQILAPDPQFDSLVYKEICDKRKRGDILNWREEAYLIQYKENILKGI